MSDSPPRSFYHAFVKLPLLLSGALALGWSFWLSEQWLQLCAGLALFLFGMQCLEEGLQQLAGSRLERLLALSTATPVKSLLFGMGGSAVLQSSTLVSLLTIAFVSTGLIQLSAGITIIFEANLGATTGIWLLAMAGQDFSLAPLALPLLVLGVLAGFCGDKSKAAGRIVLGIAFIFLGIDQIKGGFGGLEGGLSAQNLPLSGPLAQLAFVGIGALATLILQSSHATLMLALAALSTGQLALWQALAITVGANLGSSLSTALVGMLSGNRSGQRLALAHVLFNAGTGLAVFFLLDPAGLLVQRWVQSLSGADNPLIQLALFQSLFNAAGVLLFWPWQAALVRGLMRWLPDSQEPAVLIAEVSGGSAKPEPVRARYLNEAALSSADSAAQAVIQELRHLERLSLEVICHALYQPVSQLSADSMDEALLNRRPDGRELAAEQLYRCHIKGVYADLLDFMSRLDTEMTRPQRQFWMNCQMLALQLVDAVKDAKHLQKNLQHFLREEGSLAQAHYLELRRQLLWTLRQLRESAALSLPEAHWQSRIQWLDEQAATYDQHFRQRLFSEVRERRLDSLHASSLMNDLGYVSRIIQSLRNVVMLSKEHQQAAAKGRKAVGAKPS